MSMVTKLYDYVSAAETDKRRIGTIPSLQSDRMISIQVGLQCSMCCTFMQSEAEHKLCCCICVHKHISHGDHTLWSK